VAELDDPAKKKVALNNLRKFDAAGRIMETAEGMDAPSPCHWCTRAGHTKPCRVWKDRDEAACAYCKRHAKAGCLARVAHEDSETESEPADAALAESHQRVRIESAESAEKIIDLEERLATAVGIIESQGTLIVELQKAMAAMRADITQTAQGYTDTAKDIQHLWEKVFPEE